MATQVPPLRGAAYYLEVSLVSQADTDIFQNNPTLAAGDVVVYQDGVLDGNIDTLPTAVGNVSMFPSSTPSWYTTTSPAANVGLFWKMSVSPCDTRHTSR